jgi:hypothetical protein
MPYRSSFQYGRRRSNRFLVIAALILVAATLPTTKIRAAAVTSFSDTLSTIKESVVANHTLTFTIQDGWDATETLTVDFADTFITTGFANTEPEDFDITDDGAEQTLVASGGCTAGTLEIEVTTVNTSTDTFTFTRCSGDATIASGSVVAIEIGTHATTGSTGNDQITNQTATENNTDSKVTLGGTFNGTGTVALEIVADNDVTVNATVDPSITCSFSGLTTTFSSLTTGAVSTASSTTAITLSTNAGSGINVTVRDDGNGTNPGLYKSSGTTYLIGSADSSYNNIVTLAAGTDGYGVKAAASGGSGATLTVDGRFDASGGANEVGGLEVGAANAVSIASATGAIASRVLTITYMAAVSGLAPAGSYTDNVTYVCTGIF